MKNSSRAPRTPFPEIGEKCALDLAIKTKKEAHGKSRQSQARPKGKNKPNTEKISIIVYNFPQKDQPAFHTSVASRSA